MKSVLLSLHPEWCHKIFNKRKTVEIRKNKPNLQVPFKVYVYMTATKERHRLWEYVTAYQNSKGDIVNGSQKVVGEFIVDRIEDFSQWEYDYPSLLRHIDLYTGTNGNYSFLDSYLQGKKKGYGWHITNPILYDEPKELSEFAKPCNYENDCCSCKRRIYNTGIFYGCNDMITRPPQSWCYVERMG